MERLRGVSEATNLAIKEVEIDGSAFLKIIKHCLQSNTTVSGELVGLDVGDTLQVTTSYPNLSDGNFEADEHDQYGYEMLKNFRNVNLDYNVVGFYQNSIRGSHQSDQAVKELSKYQKEFGRKCITLVIDSSKSSVGHISLKALRLTDGFMELLEKNDFTQTGVSKLQVSSGTIFEEFPVHIHNAALVDAVLSQYKVSLDLGVNEQLDLSSADKMDKTVEAMLESVDSLTHEQNNFHQSWKRMNDRKKKREEQGEEDVGDTWDMPNRYFSLLCASQVNSVCGDVIECAKVGFNKLYLIEGMHKTVE